MKQFPASADVLHHHHRPLYSLQMKQLHCLNATSQSQVVSGRRRFYNFPLWRSDIVDGRLASGRTLTPSSHLPIRSIDTTSSKAIGSSHDPQRVSDNLRRWRAGAREGRLLQPQTVHRFSRTRRKVFHRRTASSLVQ